ncbi:amidohydrolase [Peptoniphilaceae bacterium SGI.131]
MNIWIKNANIVTVNDNFDILKNSNLYIEGNKISHVGGFLEDFKADKIIDARGKICMPGLINAHTHMGMSVFRNYGSDVELETWLNDFIWPLESKLSLDDVKKTTELSIAEMIESGTTSFVDMYFRMDKIAESVEKTGVRAVLGRGITFPDNKVFEEEEEFYKRWNGKANGRIQTIVSPHAVYTNDREALIKAGELAKRLGCGIHIHLNETRTEMENSIKENSLPPLEYVASLGLLGPKTIGAHCVWINDKEIELAGEAGMTLVHNPASNMKLASGFMKSQYLLDKGINVALGTDGVSSNNTLDMFEEMKLASLIAKGSTLNPKALNAETTIRMATVNGAKAIGMEGKLGKLEKGYLADLILVDFNNIRHTPDVDIAAALVYSTSGQDVDTTIVDGRILYENKKFLEMDVDVLMEEVNGIFRSLMER